MVFQNDNEISTWETVIEEDPKRKLEWVAPVAGNKMVVSYLENVKSTLYVHDLETGRLLYQIPLPIGSVTLFYGRKNKAQMFLSFESFLTPTIIYQADFSKCRSSSVPIQLQEIKKTKIAGFYTKAFNVKQEFYTSKIAEIVDMYCFLRRTLRIEWKH